MKLNFGGRAVGILAGLALVGSLAQADPVGAGTFNLAGAIDVTSTAFSFGSMVNPPPGDQLARTTLPLTGQFSDVAAGVNVPVKNLYGPTNPASAGGPGPVTPGTPFLLSDWISLPDGVSLDLTNISISAASHTCSSADDAPGSICRATANSPITLEQGPDGVTALLNLSGVAYKASVSGGSTPFVGKLAADFSGETISGLLGTFFSTGHITTGYQANFVTTPTTAVPEPGALAAVGLGLLGAGLLKKRRVAR